MGSINDLEFGPITKFPADDLRASQRFITSHNKEGKGIFAVTDNGDHHKVMVNGKGVANIIYSTIGNPVDLNNEVDIQYAKKHEVHTSPLLYFYILLPTHLTSPPPQPGIHIPNGSVVRLIDFAPGVESPLHRAMSIDYGIVVEGEFELTLDSGESRIMKPGDMSVNRATMHKWRNCDQERSGRMLFVLLDCLPFEVLGKTVVQDLGDLEGEYAEGTH
ncbi:hypothetical protein B7494_g6167 [Chlorociboria aeruginascens]|nr:hypothetical protein B7494_g6167 [Chlorociboria aeruginascens]